MNSFEIIKSMGKLPETIEELVKWEINGLNFLKKIGSLKLILLIIKIFL